MNLKQTLLAAAFFASVGTQTSVGASAAENAPQWTRVKVRIGKVAKGKTDVVNPPSVRHTVKQSVCCGNCGTCGVRG